MSRTVPKKRAIELHEVDESGELILHDASSGQMVVLNAIGAGILELIDGARDVSAIVNELAQVFADVPRADIERDVDAFLADLVSRDFIELSSSQP